MKFHCRCASEGVLKCITFCFDSFENAAACRHRIRTTTEGLWRKIIRHKSVTFKNASQRRCHFTKQIPWWRFLGCFKKMAAFAPSQTLSGLEWRIPRQPRSSESKHQSLPALSQCDSSRLSEMPQCSYLMTAGRTFLSR